MKYPISWLREYVDVDATPQELADKLTFSGIEVEGIETVGSDYGGIVVGEITAVEPHPRADRLKLCRVHNGHEELDVVCGAENFGVGDKAPFVGTDVTLPNGMNVTKAKIRGVVSMGMLCAEDELGISDDHSGILLLDREVPAGTPLADVLGPPETVLDLEITWNRPDCLSILGVAREIAALYQTQLKLPAADVREAGPPVEDLVRVSIEDEVGCPRYTARALAEIKIGPSPHWMQKRLQLCGVRPINNVVDITNYVMLECGQPLHAFDYAKVGGGEIRVRRATPGDALRTLDDLDRDLTPEMLVIADAHRPVALAGVMGGAGSEIGPQTKTVLLESATFDPALLHRTSVAVGLATESSTRYERHVDADRVEWCSRRAAHLMAAHAGAVVRPGVVDCYPGRQAPREIECRYQRVRDLLGITIRPDEVIGILARLEIEVISREEDCCRARIPSFRPDLMLEADLIEEVARIHGLAEVPDTWPRVRIVPDADDRPTRAVSACRNTLVGLGLHEAMHYSFVSSQLLDAFQAGDTAQRVVLPNPVSADHSVLRNSLIPQMMESLGRNLAHQASEAALFEIGRIFHLGEKGAVVEEDRLSLALMGPVGRIGPDGNRPVAADEIFLWLKGIIERLGDAQHVHGLAFEPCTHPAFAEGACVVIRGNGLNMGVMGIPRDDLRHGWRMSEPVALAEIELRPLCRNVFETSEIQPTPAYPGIRRDIALLVDEKTTHEDILRVIRAEAPPELTEVTLFDIFQGKGLGKGRKSMAYSLTYRSLDRSLTDEEVNAYDEAIRKALENGLKVTLRDG